MQDKAKEIEFFNRHAELEDDYNVFSNESTQKIVDSCVEFSGLKPGATVIDLGCGSGIFTGLLAKKGFKCTGIDISPSLISIADEGALSNSRFRVLLRLQKAWD